MELKTQYQQRVDETERELQIVRNKILRISSLRVVLFLAGIFGVIYGYDAGAAALCLITALTFVPFLILVKFHNRLFFRKNGWKHVFASIRTRFPHWIITMSRLTRGRSLLTQVTAIP